MARPAPVALAPLTAWITPAALDHGAELASHVAERLAISRRRAQALLRKLELAQWLTRVGSARRPCYRPGPLRQVVRRYDLQGLQEDAAWRDDFNPCFELPAAVRHMAQHAFTELLNNAADHSGGKRCTVSVRQTPLQLQLLVSDDGCGLFDHIQRHFDVPDPRQAMLALAKGKLTSAPERHSGHGLFFTARLADVVDLHANGSAFQCRDWERRQWRTGRPATRSGTSVYLAINLDTSRTLDGVLRAHSADAAGYAFEQTSVPVQLAASSGCALLSRADARRVAFNLQRFRRAELCFDGIDDVGHSFADELFRVFARQHPQVELVPLAMQPRVAAMVGAARAAA